MQEVQVDQLSDVTGKTGLHYAALMNEVDAIRWLLDSGANINAQDANGSTPLHDAILHNNVKAIQMLLKGIPDLTIKNDKGNTCLEYATSLRSKGHCCKCTSDIDVSA